MEYSTIIAGVTTLIALGAVFMIFKHWKSGAWAEVFGVLGISAIMWALLTGKDLFGIVWKFMTGILSVFGIHVK
ncbi:MAG: hypothetical protein ACRCSC_01235 [Lactococcus garvieae]